MDPGAASSVADIAGGPATRIARVAASLRRLNRHPGLVRATRTARKHLPGDHRVDPLTTAGARTRDFAVRYLGELTGEVPGVLGELGMTTLQLWQALSESRGRGRGDRDIAVLFTDLVKFSAWALEVGDEEALSLLRDVSAATEPAILEHGGRVVKRLGDGLMATFLDAESAVDAALEASERAEAIEVRGYRPAMRAGIHLGRPRRLGDDYFGVDVNVAARLAQAAGPGELLVSDRTAAMLHRDGIVLTAREFRAEGAPEGLAARCVTRVH